MAELCAVTGLVLGVLATVVPGFPGCAIAVLGVAAYAGMTDFAVVTREATVLAGFIGLCGIGAQLAAPVASTRAAGGTAGAASGAALGALTGAMVAMPGVSLVAAVFGALVLGVAGSKGVGVIGRLRGSVGAAGGCMVAMLADLVAVVGVAAVLGAARFSAGL